MKKLALRIFCLNFHEYVVCLVLRPSQTKFGIFIFVNANYVTREIFSIAKISTYTVTLWMSAKHQVTALATLVQSPSLPSVYLCSKNNKTDGGVWPQQQNYSVY